MSLNTREIKIVMITFFVTSLIYLLIFSDIRYLFTGTDIEIKKHGEVITKQDLINLSTRYEKDNKSHKVNYKDPKGKLLSVVAFKFETWQIEEIINKNKALNFANGEKPNNIIIYMAKENSFWDEGRMYPEVSVSILGTQIKDGVETLLDKNINDGPTIRIPGPVSIFNKATACPPGCPLLQ